MKASPEDMAMMEEAMAPEPRGMKPEMGGGEVCVPLKALAQPDDGDTLHTPEVGDSGTMQVDFTVSRVDGENAYLKPMAVNGVPVGKEAKQDEQAPEEDPMEAPMDKEGMALREEAGGMGQ